MIIQDITSAVKQIKKERKRSYASLDIGYKRGGQPYVIDTSKVEKAKRYKENMERGKTKKQVENLNALTDDQKKRYDVLRNVKNISNKISQIINLQKNDLSKNSDSLKKLLILKKEIEFVSEQLYPSITEWYKPISDKQWFYIEKAQNKINENIEFLI